MNLHMKTHCNDAEKQRESDRQKMNDLLIAKVHHHQPEVQGNEDLVDITILAPTFDENK